ncbi:prolyl oligopeptidase family serine peptidase [Microbacterium testaceum]|uniref:alpha/beta hydrolase family protein n=1 Tax=Microbacterium testaceum TaxID=2033 RepID=UPI00344A4DFE
MPHHTPRTEAYGDHPDQWVRIVGDASAELVFCFVHGGYWRPRYTAELMDPLVERIAHGEAGVAAVNIEYRREGDVVAMQADVRSALRRARQLFRDAVRVVVGHSAGGHLALVCADEAELVVALAPVTDLVGGYAARIGSDAVAELMGTSPAESPAAYDAATPQPSLVPTLVVHGADDDRVPVSHGRDFAQRARETGAPVDLFEFAQLDHMLLIDPDGPHWPAVEGWVRRQRNDRRKDAS